MEAICSSATAVDFHQAERRYVPEAVTLLREHLFLAYFPYFEKKKNIIRLMPSPCYLCVCVSPRYQLSIVANQSLRNLVCITLRWA
jgi:hypothetical protein